MIALSHLISRRAFLCAPAATPSPAGTGPRPRGLRRLAVVALAALACNLTGSDSDNRDHKCLISTEQAWDAWGFRLEHEDPRTCPIVIANHVLYNDWVTFSGDVVDPQSVHYGSARVLVVTSDGGDAGEDPEPFFWDGQTYRAQFAISYHAGTGSGGVGSDDGHIEIPIRYGSSYQDIAIGDVNLQVCVSQYQPCTST